MTILELFDSVISDLNAIQIHPLHKAMLEESCENAINNEQGVTDKDTLIYAARVAFITCNSVMKETINTALSKADTVTINYRGLALTFEKSSPSLKIITIMTNTVYEIVNEYIIHPQGLDFPVRGRVLKGVEPTDSQFNYTWEISHYYKPHEDAIGVYIPSAKGGNTFEEVQHMLFRYMKPFTNIDVVAGDY